MADSEPKQPNKRKVLKLMVLAPWVTGCSKTAQADATDDLQKRFKGVGVVLVVDAVAGTEMKGVVIYDDRGVKIYDSAVVSRRVRGIMALSGGRVPVAVHAIWRQNPHTVWGENGGIDYEGEIAGDYTMSVAERIPNEVLSDIHAHRGNLRLKFRLKPDGILVGWDIERPAPLGDVSIFEMPGGDFLETHY